MLDAAARSAGLRRDSEMSHQRAAGIEMRGNNWIARERAVPIAHPRQKLHITLAARRHEMPRVLLAQRQQIRGIGFEVSKAETFPFAESDFCQPVVGAVSA